MRITLKTEGGKAFVTVNGKGYTFPVVADAFKFIYYVRGVKIKKEETI